MLVLHFWFVRRSVQSPAWFWSAGGAIVYVSIVGCDQIAEMACHCDPVYLPLAVFHTTALFVRQFLPIWSRMVFGIALRPGIHSRMLKSRILSTTFPSAAVSGNWTFCLLRVVPIPCSIMVCWTFIRIQDIFSFGYVSCRCIHISFIFIFRIKHSRHLAREPSPFVIISFRRRNTSVELYW